MAKRRRVKRQAETPKAAPATASARDRKGEPRSIGTSNGNAGDDVEEGPFGRSRLNPLSIAAGLFAGAIVYVAYYPSDSVSVEQGDALWLAVLSLVIVTLCMTFGSANPIWRGRSSSERALLIGPWCLAGWMMVAAFGTSSVGNLRLATNEAWLWVTAASMFTSARILCESVSFRRAITTLVIVCAFGQAVHGLHQNFVSLPANRLEYSRDPDRVIELAGLDAPEGSAERMVFENRLFDGGPTGTFALANSLAAVLLLGVVGGICLASRSYRSFRAFQWTCMGILVGVCIGSLLATRSRSGMLAMLVGIGMVLIATSTRGRHKRSLAIGVGAITVIAAGVIAFLAMFGNREWFEAAPASVAFRFQYWRSTWHLALDAPIFGAGPGNFQSLYEPYREASAHEQIAEPHNLFVETLASGGFIGLALLVGIIVAGVIYVASSAEFADTDSPRPETETDRDRWVWLGAGCSFLMVWLLSLASGQLPDLLASMWVVPASVALGWVLWSILIKTSAQTLDRVWLVVVVATGVHLLASGGWTVPGVAMSLWTGCGLLTRHSAREPSADATQVRQRPRWGLLAAGMAAACCLYFGSLKPVDARQRLMMTATTLERPNQRRLVLEQAVEADPWSADAVLWLADWYRWSLVYQGDDARSRDQWHKYLRMAEQRVGQNPSMLRMVAIQRLHVYQRYGNPADLQDIGETLGAAVDWSPSNQWLMAQMALVAMAQNDGEAAQNLARRAEELSGLGENIERALSRQQIYVVRNLGVNAQSEPVRVPADQALAALLPNRASQIPDDDSNTEPNEPVR